MLFRENHLIAKNIPGMKRQNIVERKTGVAKCRTVSPAHPHLICCTLVHKRRKQDRDFDGPNAPALREQSINIFIYRLWLRGSRFVVRTSLARSIGPC